MTAWAKGNELPNFAFHFYSSSETTPAARKKQNAVYYSRRGMFHISKGNTELAYGYLRQACNEQKGIEQEHDLNTKTQFAMAILARCQEKGIQPSEQTNRARKSGPPGLDDQGGDTLLRDQYMWVLNTFPDIEKLKADLKELKRQQLAVIMSGRLNEWSYDKALASDQVHEVESREDRYVRPEGQAHEMQGDMRHAITPVERTVSLEVVSPVEIPVERVVSHELSVERSHSSRDDIEDEDLNTGPNGPQKKSRMASKLIHRFKIGHGKVE